MEEALYQRSSRKKRSAATKTKKASSAPTLNKVNIACFIHDDGMPPEVKASWMELSECGRREVHEKVIRAFPALPAKYEDFAKMMDATPIRKTYLAIVTATK